MNLLTAFITTMFKNSEQDSLESFLENKKIDSHEELEYWIKQHQQLVNGYRSW